VQNPGAEPPGGVRDPGAHQRRLRRPDQRPRPAAGLHQPAAL